MSGHGNINYIYKAQNYCWLVNITTTIKLNVDENVCVFILKRNYNHWHLGCLWILTWAPCDTEDESKSLSPLYVREDLWYFLTPFLKHDNSTNYSGIFLQPEMIVTGINSNKQWVLWLYLVKKTAVTLERGHFKNVCIWLTWICLRNRIDNTEIHSN